MSAPAGSVGFEQAEPQFDPQNPPDGIIQARQRDRSVPNLIECVVVHVAPGIGRHVHVHAGIECLRTASVGTPDHFAVAIPVADHETVKTQSLLEDGRQQPMVAVHLFAIPTRKGGHDRLHTCRKRGNVPGAVDIAEFGLGDARVALVLALVGTAVADVVLGGGDYPAVAEKSSLAHCSLQALDDGRGVASDQGRVFRIAFVGAAPAMVARDGHGRRKGPLEAGRPEFQCGRGGDPADQVRVVGCAKPDVMWKQGRTHHIVVAMDGINAEQDRNRRASSRCVH